MRARRAAAVVVAASSEEEESLLGGFGELFCRGGWMGGRRGAWDGSRLV